MVTEKMEQFVSCGSGMALSGDTGTQLFKAD